MPFLYYRKLSARSKAIYRASDAVGDVPLGEAARFAPVVEALRRAIEGGEPRDVQAGASRLCLAITTVLRIEPLTVKVLSRRPSNASGELHGLYVREVGKPAVIRIWVRTAQQRRVVAFRTFLRTLLHEVGHHLDFTLYRWSETFHTEGFFRRESSLVRQLLPGEERRRRIRAAADDAPAVPVHAAPAPSGEAAPTPSRRTPRKPAGPPAGRRGRAPTSPAAGPPAEVSYLPAAARKPVPAAASPAAPVPAKARRPERPQQLSLFPEPVGEPER